MTKKFLTIVVCLSIIVGLFVYSQRDNNTKSTTASQQVKPSSTPEVIPNRELKPNEKFIAPLGMYITVPKDMNFRIEDFGDDPGRPATAAFFIEKGSIGEPSYQLYVLQQAKDVESDMLQKAQTEMDPSTIQEINIGSYKGLEGLITGPKTRWSAHIIKDHKLIYFYTYPTALEYKHITDQILSTISFQ